MNLPVRVLIVDDHPVVRDGLRALLGSTTDFEVVGEAAGGLAAIREARTHRPDVVIMDVHLPDLDGVEATRRLRRVVPESAVLVLSMLEDDDTVFAAMRAGACGYLVKGASQGDIEHAIQAVAAGGAFLGPQVARRILGLLTDPRRDEPPFPELTPREFEVLDLIATGLSNPQIATRLYISGKTVSNHVSNIFAKLQLPDRATAIVRAREAGLGHG
ncbi:response regulator [Nitriliruptor alkaliphilus]|uniref:response regulator n=1 Tax=Nitriliruptor alkaliphilus TaxID=427918 RepID=UPI0006961101|nr:response regulator transcription factor [Nitriliruptor alkaliphilus]